MKIAVDAYNIALAHGTGVATYGRTLVRSARALGHDVNVLFGARVSKSRDPLLQEIALAESTGPLGELGAASRIGVGFSAARSLALPRSAGAVPVSGRIVLPSGLQLGTDAHWNAPNLYHAAQMAFYTARAFSRVTMPGVEVAHWTYPLPVRMPGARNIYTLHDLVPLRLPYTTADIKQVYYRLCRRIVRRADHIVTVSECSRRDIVEILGADPARVTNLYQSTDIAQVSGFDEADIAAYCESLLNVPPRGYYLFFGAIEPKKNVARLVEAYLSSGSKCPLVIVGAPGWGSKRDIALLKSMTALDMGKRIIWLGFLPRDMLARLIAGARATIFPSLYEGFGLPVLESMALGTPVITSNVSSLPEVVGEAALYVDPYRAETIAAAIRTMDGDADLRAALPALGRAQAEKFGDTAYRARLAKFYSSLA